MSRSIGSQILIPIAAIQAVTVACVALATAGFAASRIESEMVERLNGVAETIEHATFPLTGPVLARMHDLSGADFVVSDPQGRAITSTIPELTELSSEVRSLAIAGRVQSLKGIPQLSLNGVSYFAVRLGATPRTAATLILLPESSLRQARWKAAIPPLALGGLSLLLMVATTYYVAQRTRNRLRQLQGQVARVAEGDFIELELGRWRDEVDELSQSINEMSTQLRQMRRSIEQNERTRLLAQVAAGLAHQLRNSISGARMSIQLHAKRSPAREGDRSLEVALRQLTMTEGQIRGLLSLGRVERRATEPCQLNAMLEEITMLVEPTCRHVGVALVYQHSSDPIEISADTSALQAAILNLVINAIEAAGQGGEVELSTTCDAGFASVKIKDDGPGPGSDLAETLFDPFVTGKPEGVGLGLALAKQVASEHGGSLSWSREDNRTLFQLSLPIRPQADREVA